MNAKFSPNEFKHPSDGWSQIEPAGLHPNKSAEVVQVIDKKAIQSIVEKFNADADAGTLSHGHEMLLDNEHFSHNPDKETRAFGWATGLQARPEGIFSKIRWTNTGKAATDGGDYRFFSTEYDVTNLQNYEEVPASEIPADIQARYSGWRFVRPLTLVGLTLTNRPNNKGSQPITNRQGQSAVILNHTGHEEADKTLAQRIINRANELKLADPTCPFVTCWNRARNEIFIPKSPSKNAVAVQSGKSNAEKQFAAMIRNRAHELKNATPARSFQACWEAARREFRA